MRKTSFIRRSLHGRNKPQPVDLPGHPDVRQDQIDLNVCSEKFESLVGTLRLNDLKASIVKLIRKIEPQEQSIFNHHDGVVQDAVLRCASASALGLPLLQSCDPAPKASFGNRKDVNASWTCRLFVGAPL